MAQSLATHPHRPSARHRSSTSSSVIAVDDDDFGLLLYHWCVGGDLTVARGPTLGGRTHIDARNGGGGHRGRRDRRRGTGHQERGQVPGGNVHCVHRPSIYFECHHLPRYTVGNDQCARNISSRGAPHGGPARRGRRRAAARLRDVAGILPPRRSELATVGVVPGVSEFAAPKRWVHPCRLSGSNVAGPLGVGDRIVDMNVISRWFLVVASMVLAVTGSAVAAAPAYAAPCPDVEVVFARGTFEPPGVGSHRAGLRRRPASQDGRQVGRRVPRQLPCLARLRHRCGRRDRRQQQGPRHGRKLPQHEDRRRRLLPGRRSGRLHHRGQPSLRASICHPA